jgi:3-deoxy-7-phosphoheptulonate synthase
MLEQIDDIRIDSLQSLITPEGLIRERPLTIRASHTIKQSREIANQIIQGRDPRLLVVVGPCSIHDNHAAIEYAHLLKQAADQYADDLHIIMRVYFEKPRTIMGWKGLISDPRLDGSFDINHGLTLARSILLDICHLGVPTATEFLDTIIPQYLSDLISWSAIGARTTESQIHRELASGLSMPVGFKNTTDGNIRIAIDAVNAARHAHRFLSIAKNGIASIVQTTGNPNCHIILRGSTTSANYTAESVNEAADNLKKANLTPRLMIDCSHGNSRKIYQRQMLVVDSIVKQLANGCASICGVMLESNLTAGKQSLDLNRSLTYGQSITDGCLGWEETVPLLEKLALAIKHC